MTINRMNDPELCEQIRKIHKADGAIDMMLRENLEHPLFMNLRMMRDAIDNAMHRMNQLQPKQKVPTYANLAPGVPASSR